MSAVDVDERQRLAELAAEINEGSQKLRKLEGHRQYKRAGDPEQIALEHRIANLRLRINGAQAVFDDIHKRVEVAAEEERLRLEEEKRARRPGLEKQRDELMAKRDLALSSVEYQLGELADAIRAALVADSEVERLRVELEEVDRVLERARRLIEHRVTRRLVQAGLRDFYAMGLDGLEELADPAEGRARVVALAQQLPASSEDQAATATADRAANQQSTGRKKTARPKRA